MSETKHTPTPWAVDREGPKILITRIHPDIADYKDDIGEAYTLADAAFIVQVVNAHDDLVKACRYAISQLEAAGIPCGDVKAALAKAKGE